MQLTKGRIITGLVMVLLLGGLFLAYDASRHAHSTFDVIITRYVQGWDTPGVGSSLRVISEITNLWPGVAIWTATSVILFWRGLRIEAFTLLLAVGTFLAAEALGVLVNRPRPSPELVHVSQSLFGNSFPSGHIFGAVVFYGLLIGMSWHRIKWLPIRLLILAIAVPIIALAGVARVYLGVHWANDVLGGLLFGVVTLAALLWVYSRLRAGHLELLGLYFHVTRRRWYPRTRQDGCTRTGAVMAPIDAARCDRCDFPSGGRCPSPSDPGLRPARALPATQRLM